MTSNKSFSNALKWSYLGNWGERGFSALFTFIFAAILGPTDYGLLGIAMLYIAFLQLFLDQGFVAALIQRKDLKPEHLNAVFWMDMVLSAVLLGVSILVSGWWAARNNAPEASTIIIALSLCIPIWGLSAVQGAILSRNMNFKALSIRSNVSVLVSGLVGIVLALSGFGVWSLVGQQLTRDLLSVVILWKMSSWRPSWSFSWRHLKELTGFSLSNFTAQVAIFADNSASTLFLGIFFGPVAVGLYHLADKIVFSVVAMATSSIQSVSLPEFSRLQDQPEELRRSALSCIRLSSIVTLPALCGLAAVSWPLLSMLGPEWTPASDATKILCVVGMSTVFAYFTGPILQATSRPHLVAVLVWARVLVSTVLIILGGMYVRNDSASNQLIGISGVRFVVSTLLVMPIYLGILMRITGIQVREILSAVAPSAFGSAASVLAVMLVQFSGVLAGASPLIMLIIEIGLGGSAGLAVLLTLDLQVRAWVKSLLRMGGSLSGKIRPRLKPL